MTIFDELKARGLLAQLTDEEEIKELINNGKATGRIGKLSGFIRSLPRRQDGV